MKLKIENKFKGEITLINTTMLYKQMKNWVGGKSQSPTFQNIFFSNNTAFATDTHKLVMVKNWKVDKSYMEDVKGNRPNEPEMEAVADDMYTKSLKVIPSNEKCQWSATIHRKWFPHMKNACEFIKKATKKAQYPGMSVLNHTNQNLYLISGDVDLFDTFGVKFLLADDMTYRDDDFSAGANWYGFWNAGYLGNALDFAIESEAMQLTLSIQFNHFNQHDPNTPERNKWTGIWKIETDELIMIATSMRCSDKKDYGRLDKMIELEAKRPLSGAWIELPQE